MNWRKWPYWLKGGVLAVALYVALIVLAIISFGLAFGETINPQSIFEASLALLFAAVDESAWHVVVYFGKVFAAGAVFGIFYDFCTKKGKKKLFWILLLVAGLIFAFRPFVFPRHYPNPTSAQDCAKLKDQIDTCYHDLAMRNKDGTLCDLIPLGGLGRWNCYVDVADKTKDSSLCDLIPTEFEVQKDRCFTKVHLCESILDATGKKSCKEYWGEVDN